MIGKPSPNNDAQFSLYVLPPSFFGTQMQVYQLALTESCTGNYGSPYIIIHFNWMAGIHSKIQKMKERLLSRYS